MVSPYFCTDCFIWMLQVDYMPTQVRPGGANVQKTGREVARSKAMPRESDAPRPDFAGRPQVGAGQARKMRGYHGTCRNPRRGGKARQVGMILT
jgi:hypothetical protein